MASEKEKPPRVSVVIATVNCEVILDPRGFYARCNRCPWVSEYTPAKHVARRWANEHDNDE